MLSLVGIVVIGLAIALLLGFLLNYLLRREHSFTDQVFEAQQNLYKYGLEIMEKMIDRLSQKSIDSGRANEVIRGIFYKVGLEGMKLLEPKRIIFHYIKKEIEEAAQMLERAEENARRYHRPDVMRIVENLSSQLGQMANLTDAESVNDLRSRIRQIRNVAEKIANAESFHDGPQDESAGNDSSRPHDRSEDDYYRVLNVKSDATQEEIKSSYRRLCNVYHPDKFKTQPEWVQKQAEETMKKINEAYNTLKEPNKRKNYDQRRQAHG